MTETKTLVSIQALRAVAALAVAVAHTYAILGIKYGVSNYPTLLTGAAGVDLFFVISGFIMVYASDRLFGSQGAPATFLLRRLIRIVPLYWAVTTFMLCYLLWQYRDLAVAQSSWPAVAHSYLFIPYLDVPLSPVVGVGWTLNYEMFFYLVFSVFLLLPRRAAAIALSIALTAFGLFGRSFALPAALSYLADPIVLEFVFGVIIGLVYREIPQHRKALGGALLALGAAGFAASALFDLSQFSRVVIWGIPSACVVAGAVLYGEPPSGPFWRTARFLGDISYSLYLTHGLTMGAMKLVNPLLDPRAWPVLYACLLVGAALIVASAVHLLFERPVTQWLRGRMPSG